MQTVDVTKLKDPVRVLLNAFEPGTNPRGTQVIYYIGDYFDQVGRTAIGRAAWDLYASGKADLVQRVIKKSPRIYEYIAQVK